MNMTLSVPHRLHPCKYPGFNVTDIIMMTLTYLIDYILVKHLLSDTPPQIFMSFLLRYFTLVPLLLILLISIYRVCLHLTNRLFWFGPDNCSLNRINRLIVLWLTIYRQMRNISQTQRYMVICSKPLNERSTSPY